MRLLIGDDVGQAKIITTSRSIDTTLPSSVRPTTISFFPPSRTRPIQHALPVTYLSEANLAAVFSKGGLLRIFDPGSPPHSPNILFTHTLDVPPETDTISLSLSNDSTTLTAATATGATLFLNLQSGTHTTAHFPGPISTFASYPFSTSTPVPPAIATAAENRDLEIYSPSNTTTPIWKAKNVKPNALKLAAPIHPTCIVFLPSNAPDSYRFLVATKHGALRIYDTAVSKRPVWTASLGKSSILQLSVLGELPGADVPLMVGKGESAEKACLAVPLKVVFSDSAGLLETFDLTARRAIGTLKGVDGSVLGVCVKGGLVAGVGLGRYVGVWEGNRMVSRVFVKTQGCCVAVLEEGDAVEEMERAEGGGGEEGEEDVWQDLEEVGEEGDGGKGKRKKEVGKANGVGKKRRVEE